MTLFTFGELHAQISVNVGYEATDEDESDNGLQNTATGTSYILKAYSGDFGDVNPVAAFYNAATATEGGGATSNDLHFNWGWKGNGDGWYNIYGNWGPSDTVNYYYEKNMIINIHYKGEEL